MNISNMTFSGVDFSKVLAFLGVKPQSIYLRLQPQRLFVKNLESGAVFDEPAVMVISGDGVKKDIRAIGHNAAPLVLEAGTEGLWPLDDGITKHEEAARALLEYAIHQVAGKTLVKPTFYLHIARENPPSLAELSMIKKICTDIGAVEIVSLDNKDLEGMTPEKIAATHDAPPPHEVIQA